MSATDLASRAIGQFPLSIATSLAIEAAVGIHEDFPVDTVPILEYDELWVNLRTLFRNLHGSLEKGVAEAITTNTCAVGMNQEMEDIYNIVKEHSNAKTNVIFYVSNYSGIDKKYPHAVIRRDSTPKQKMYTTLLEDVITLLLKQHPEGNIRVVPLKLHPEKKTKALIITHIAYDLVSWNEFEKLTLLESHTGAIRERSQWHRKYCDGKNLPMIPFREDLIQIFGDQETFRPTDPKIRKELIEIATKYKWNPLTTTLKIKYGVDQMSNPYAKEVLRSILV